VTFLQLCVENGFARGETGVENMEAFERRGFIAINGSFITS
jgi:hypothetical protein